jgi:hypothetical protein
MGGRPIGPASAWSGFICALLALRLLMDGFVAAALVMLIGTVVLGGFAIWLAHLHH